MPPEQPPPGAGRETLGMVGLAAAVVLCCAAPVLIAAGALGALGALVRSPWLLIAAAVVVLATAGYALQRARRTSGPREACCPPPAPDPAHAPTERTPTDDLDR